jgi:hypothetical protein
VTANQDTKQHINKQLSNNFHQCYQHDARDKWRKHSEDKEIKSLLFNLFYIIHKQNAA